MLQAIQSKSFSNALSLGSGIASTFWATWFEMIRNLSFGWGCSFPWGPTLLTTTFSYHLALWWLWCSGSCLAPRQSPASWPQRASTWTAGSQVLIFLMQPWPVSAALFVEGNLSFTCTLYFWTFVLGCGAQCFCCLFCVKWQNTIFLWAAPLQGMGKNLSSFLVELVMCPEPPAGY